MKKLLLVLAILGVLFLWVKSSYNGLVKEDESVKNAWSKVQTQYQRRADLFMNQIETVKGAAKNEKDILVGVTNARAGITEAQSKMGTATTPAELDAAMSQAKQAAMNFKIQVEAYPTVRSTEAFLNFQTEISGTENRIATARNEYNDAVQIFNTKVRQFPMNIFAGIFKMNAKPTFEADKASQNAPKASF